MAKDKKEPGIRSLYKPTEKEKDITAHVYARYLKMKDNNKRKDIEKEWDKAERNWDQSESDDHVFEDWQADYFVPLTTGIVENILEEMVDQSPRPIILPLSAEDKPKATVMRHAFEYTWDIADGDIELEDTLKDTLIYGTGFVQEYYWKDRRLVKTLASINRDKKGKKIKEYNETEIFEYDDCYMECVSPYSLYFDENARTINRGPYKARDAIRRYIMDIEDFKMFFSGDVWNPLDNAKFVKPGGDTNYYEHYKPPEDVDKSSQVEVLWYWSRRPEDWCIVVANDVPVIIGPNNYKHKQLPFAMTYDVKRPHQFYHKGEPKLLEAIQKEVNTMRRMITDRNHLDIDKMWLISRDETYAEEDTMSRPHGTIRVDDPANYKPIEYGDIPSSVGMSLGEVYKDAVRVTRYNDRFQQSQTPITATDASIRKEEMIKSVKAKLRRLEKGLLVDVGRMRTANIIQFYSQPRLEQIVGEAGSQEYANLVAKAQKEGIYQEVDNVGFTQEYRDITIKDRELIPDARGKIVEQPTKGYTFFKMKPETFIPVARGGFRIKFQAGSTMPVSKSLMAKQTQDAVSMLMPLATAGVGYDPVKLGDSLLESLDIEPSDYHLDQPEQDIESARAEASINIAAQENEEVSKGAPIPELGTPYATADHTRIHIAYIKSNKAKQLPEDRYRKLVKHAMGEITAQTSRGDVTSLTGGQVPAIENSGAPAPQAGASPAPTDMQMAGPGTIPGGEHTTEDTQKGSMMSRVLSLFKGKK
ncbi:MAG: hypothetical protein WC810_14355 [Janthinobacterium sp.]|jgi:hypothetical protein